MTQDAHEGSSDSYLPATDQYEPYTPPNHPTPASQLVADGMYGRYLHAGICVCMVSTSAPQFDHVVPRYPVGHYRYRTGRAWRNLRCADSAEDWLAAAL